MRLPCNRPSWTQVAIYAISQGIPKLWCFPSISWPLPHCLARSVRVCLMSKGVISSPSTLMLHSKLWSMQDFLNRSVFLHYKHSVYILWVTLYRSLQLSHGNSHHIDNMIFFVWFWQCTSLSVIVLHWTARADCASFPSEGLLITNLCGSSLVVLCEYRCDLESSTTASLTKSLHLRQRSDDGHGGRLFS